MVSRKAFTGMAGGSAVVLAAWVAAYFAHREYEMAGFSITFLIGLGGIAAGWLLGFLASPYNPGETKTFAKYASLISMFVSGYALAKIEPAIAEVFGDARVLSITVYGLRVVVFGICLVASSITMYVFRLYTGPHSPDFPPVPSTAEPKEIASGDDGSDSHAPAQALPDENRP